MHWVEGRWLPWFMWLSGTGGLSGLFLIQTFHQTSSLRLHWQSLFRGTRCLHFLRFSEVLPNEFICFLTFPVTSTYLSASGLLRSQLLVSWSDALQLSVYFWQFSLLFSLFSPVFLFINVLYFKKFLSCHHFCNILRRRRDKHIHVFYSLSVTGNIYLKFGCHAKTFIAF